MQHGSKWWICWSQTCSNGKKGTLLEYGWCMSSVPTRSLWGLTSANWNSEQKTPTATTVTTLTDIKGENLHRKTLGKDREKTGVLTRELEPRVSGGVAYAGRGVSPIGHVRLGALSLAVNDRQAQTQTLSVGLSPGKVDGDTQIRRPSFLIAFWSIVTF